MRSLLHVGARRFHGLRDESGIALVTVIILMALLTAVSVSLLSLSTTDATQSRATVTSDGAYQAAEAGLNAYVADLTEDTGFFLDYMAKGEARRTYSGSQWPPTPGQNVSQNYALNPSWPRQAAWTYPTNITTDPGWRDTGNGYQYLLEVFPDPNSAQNTRIVAFGRPKPTAQHPASDKSTYRAIETVVRSLSVSDFQMLTAANVGYGSNVTTSGLVYVGLDDSGGAHTLSYDGHATASILTENNRNTVTTSGGSQSINITAPAAVYAKNTTPSIRSLLRNPIYFSDLRATPQLTPPPGATMGAIQANATATGLTLPAQDDNSGVIPDGWWLQFASNGTLTVLRCMHYQQTVNGSTRYYDFGDNDPTSFCSSYRTISLPAGGFDIYSQEDVIVTGTVNGQVTVYTAGGGTATSGDQATSQGNIYIGGAISYAQPGQDVLGMIADNNVEISCWEPSSSLTWRGATMALSGKWASADAWSYCSSGSRSGSMTYIGSSATYGGGSMGMFRGTHDYQYDSTLRYLPPPDYPQIPASFTVVYQREIPVP